MSEFDLPLTLATAVIVPTLLGALAGFPLWRKRKAIFGNIVASIIVGIVVIFLIARVFALFFGCTAAESADCNSPTMTQFATRVLIGLAVIGWIDVFILLFVSGIVEDRARKGSIRLEDL
jgi:ABC-type branched-subunit amino acid transport system permease subunit